MHTTLRSLLRAALISLVLAVALAPAMASGESNSPYPTYKLTITLNGNGSGIWQTTNSAGSADGRMRCEIVQGVVTAASICSHTYNDPFFVGSVTLYYRATPAAGSKVCDSGTCTNTLSSSIGITSDTTFGYEFPLSPYLLFVSKTGTGTGNVSSSPFGINCGVDCSSPFLFGTNVTLTATSDAGASFVGWTGAACAGQDATCSLTIPASSTTANAVFAFGTPTASPKPSTAPGTTPHPTRTPAPTSRVSAAPHASTALGPTLAPPASDAPAASAAATDEATLGATPLEAPSPVAPSPAPALTATTGTDLTPVVIAILGAGVLIAVGLGFLAFSLRRRPSA